MPQRLRKKIKSACCMVEIIWHYFLELLTTKGQLISKANCEARNSSKKGTNEFVFTSMRRVFVRFLEESSARKNVSRLSDL